MAGILCAAWLLAGFVLPNTWVARATLSLSPHFLSSSNGIGLSAGLFALACGYAFWRCRREGQRLLFWLCIACYGAWFVIGAYRQHAEGGQHRPFAEVTLTMALGLLAGYLAGDLRWLSRLLVALLLCQAIFVLYRYLGGFDSFLSGTVVRAVGTFNDPQDISRLMLFGLPLAAGLSFEAQGIWRWVSGVAFAVMAGAMLVTFDRGSILASAISLCVFAWRVGVDRKKLLVSAGVLAAICVGVFLIRSSGPANQHSTAGSNAGRLRYWQQTIDIVRAHPAGVGADGIVLRNYDPLGTQVVDSSEDPKNLALLFLLILGWPGMGVLAVLTYLGWDRFRGPQKPVELAAGAALLAVLVAGCFDTPIGNLATLPSTAIGMSLLGVAMLTPYSRESEHAGADIVAVSSPRDV